MAKKFQPGPAKAQYILFQHIACTFFHS